MTYFSRFRRLVPLVAAAVLGVVIGATAQAQGQSAVITGRVLSNKGQPLYGANVFITEMNISAGTNEAGRYTITIPAERVHGQSAILRVRSIGQKPVSKPILITAGSQ